jgi:hypothetical protein
MQLFGILGLLLTIALAAWWLSTGMHGSGAVSGTDRSTDQYQEATEQAQEIVDQINQ